MNISLRYVILYVADHQRTLHFYRDLLGLPVRAEHGTYVEFDTGSTILSFNTKESVTELIGLQMPESPLHSQTFELGLVVPDVAACIEKLRSAGVPVIKEPTVKPWGQTVAYVTDPDGHYIEICTAIE